MIDDRMLLPHLRSLTRHARPSIASGLAVAIAALLTAGTPIAIQQASLSTLRTPPAERQPPSARDGIDVAIARPPAAAGSERIRSVVSPAEASPAIDEATTPETTAMQPFEIVLPEGWTGGEIEDFDDDAERSFRYQDEAGRYFVVNLDPSGSDFEADEVWRYHVVNDDRFEVADEDRCVPGEPLCSLGDGEKTIYAIWSEGGSAPLGGHTWYFRFGDESSELGGTRVFREILEAIRVTR